MVYYVQTNYGKNDLNKNELNKEGYYVYRKKKRAKITLRTL